MTVVVLGYPPWLAELTAILGVRREPWLARTLFREGMGPAEAARELSRE